MLKNITKILSATIFAQLLSTLAMPLLARLYTAHDFAVFQIYITSSTVLVLFATLKYEFAILEIRNSKLLIQLISFLFRLALFMALVCAAVIAITQTWISNSVDSLGAVLWALPIGMFIGSLQQASMYIAMRNRNYSLLSKYKITQSTTTISSSLILAFTIFSGAGLVIADLIGKLISGLQIFWRSGVGFTNVLHRVPINDLKSLIFTYQKYPKWAFPAGVLSASSIAFVPIALTGFFNLEIAGQYALIDRFIIIPVGIIAIAISQVVTGDIAEDIASNPKKAFSDFKNLLKFLIPLSILGTVFGVFVMPKLIPVIFGIEWQLAGQICQYMMPLAIATFIGAPFHMILVVTNHQKTQALWQLFRFLSIIISFAVLILNGVKSPLHVIFVYSAVALVNYLIYLVLAYRALNTAARSSTHLSKLQT